MPVKSKITKVSPEDFAKARADFEANVLSHDLKTKNGLMIILAMIDTQGVQGAMTDVENIRNVFGTFLNFVVWEIHNPNQVLKIPAIMKVAAGHEYPESIDKIFVYYTGHGGTVDGRKYVIPHSDEPSKPRSYIKEDMVMFFEPSSDCKLRPNVSRVFLFDCCLSKDSTAESKSESTDIDIDTFHQPLIIAHATSMGQVARGNFSSGGLWTRPLCDNIKNFYFLPFSYILDKTWDDVVERNDQKKEVQGPHYLCYMGLLFLKEDYRQHYYARNSTEAVKSGRVSLPPPHVGSGRTTTGGGGATVPPPASDDIDIEDIMDCRPQQPDLKAAILKDLDDTNVKVWRDRFGKRLKGPNNTQLGMCSKPEYLIDLLYGSQGPFHVTWGTVLNALEFPTPLKRESDKREIAMSLREYLSRDHVCKKYKK